jgi:hypothetical protein
MTWIQKQGLRSFLMIVATGLLAASESGAQLPPKKAVQKATTEVKKASPATTGGFSSGQSAAPAASSAAHAAGVATGGVMKSKKSFADLRKVGIEKPPTMSWGNKGARKSTSKLLAPNKRKLAPMTRKNDAAEYSARAKRYADAESKASAGVAKKLKDIRSKIASKKMSFEVGATSVAEKPIKEITGLVGEPDRKAADEQKKRRASSKKKSNLVAATMIERATPPPSAPKKPANRRDSDDVAPVAASEIIVTPDDTRGNGGAWFPSSAIPSPTNPQFSWRDKITPVKNQQFCGSCWAFAVAGAFEGSESLLNGELMDVSEQQLVNCVPAHPATSGDNCKGHLPYLAIDWLTGAGFAAERTFRIRRGWARVTRASGNRTCAPLRGGLRTRTIRGACPTRAF